MLSLDIWFSASGCNLREYLRVQTILSLLSTVTGPHMENNFKILLQGMQISLICDKLPGELSSHEVSWGARMA